MSKLYIQNLGLIITEQCNLKCMHCMRGVATSKNMKEEVIEKLNQIDSIGNLTVCGGEPTLALPTVEKVLTFIVDNHIGLDNLTMTINGTNYSDELLRLLDYIDEYIPKRKSNVNALFGISKDLFHLKDIKEKGKLDEYIKNLERYIESPHFLNYREIDKKIFREGRAEELPKEITVPIRPWPIIYTYLKSQDVMEVGPLVTINVDGMVTECDASIEHQRTLYNYGNILDENLESIITRVGEEVSPRTWYRKTGKIIKKQTTANFYMEFMPEFVKACNGQSMVLKWELENILTFGVIPNKIELKQNKILHINEEKEYMLDIYCTGMAETEEKIQSWNLTEYGNMTTMPRYKQVKTYGFDAYAKPIYDTTKGNGKLEKCNIVGLHNLFMQLCGIKTAKETTVFPNFEGIICDSNMAFVIDKRLFIAKSNRLSEPKDIAHGVDLYSMEGNKVYFIKSKRIDDKISKDSLYSYNISDGSIRLCKTIFTY